MLNMVSKRTKTTGINLLWAGINLQTVLLIHEKCAFGIYAGTDAGLTRNSHCATLFSVRSVKRT